MFFLVEFFLRHVLYMLLAFFGGFATASIIAALVYRHQLKRSRADVTRMNWLESCAIEQGFMRAEEAKCWCFYGRSDQTLREIIDGRLTQEIIDELLTSASRQPSRICR